MRPWMKIGAATLGGVAVSGVAAAAIGSARWNRETARAVGRLGGRIEDGASGGGLVGATFSPEMLVGLPAPVARYFTFALPPGQPLISRARVAHAGEFAARPGQWSPFTSVQHFRVRPPGFVWDAAIRVAPAIPGLHVRVRDSYLDGEGAMHGAVAALLPVVDQHGTPAMAAGSLARYLAEAAWLPTALLPGAAGAGVEWAPLDDSSARATLTDGETAVSLDFHFGAKGEIVRIAGERFRDVNGTGVPTRWEGHFRDYGRVHGVMVPMAGDVAWLPPEGPLPYWRGRVTRIDHELAP